MSEDLNPYGSNVSHDSALDSPPDTRPTGVTVTGVLCVLAGILGVLSGLVIFAQLAFGNPFASSMTPTGSAGGPQREMTSAIETLTSRFIIPHIGVSVGTLVLASCLLVGGIAVFQRRSWAPTWLRRVFVALIVFEIARQVFYVILQIEKYPIMEQYFNQLGSAPNSPGGNTMMKSMLKVSTIVGVVFGLGWALIKVGLGAWGHRYFGKPHVVEYFTASKNATEA